MTEILKYEAGEKLNIYLFGDMHFGNQCSKPEKFKEFVDMLSNDRYGVGIGLGDYIEAITNDDKKRVYHKEKKILIDEQWEIFKSFISPLIEKNKILGLHMGNHELVYDKRHEHDYVDDLCKEKNIKNLKDDALIDILQERYITKLYTLHGGGSSVGVGMPYVYLDNRSKIMGDINIIAEGHTHKLGVNIKIMPLIIVDDKLKQRVQYNCACGCFLGNYEIGASGYGSRAHYAPLPLGFMKVELFDGVIEKVYPVVL